MFDTVNLVGEQRHSKAFCLTLLFVNAALKFNISHQPFLLRSSFLFLSHIQLSSRYSESPCLPSSSLLLTAFVFLK